MQISLYVHIPYCLKKCNYCDFNSAASQPLPPEEYVRLVLKEMALRRETLEGPVAAPTLYFGGGTPSLLTPEQIGSLIEAAARLFSLEATAEITLEANPGTLTPEKLAGYRLTGVNRLSLGIQSFEDRLLARLGRPHSAAEALSAFRWARQAGFDNLSIDLMHSLPEQSVAQWRQALSAALELTPEHISAYGLSVEEGTPFAVQHALGQLPLPEEEDAAQMFEATVALTAAAGYRHYEISNFATPGRESRHNGAYWRRQSYLGFGAGAHSFYNGDGIGSRWQNAAGVADWAAALAAGRLPEEEREALTEEQAIAESFFLGLRQLDGLDLAPLQARFGEAALASRLKEVQRLIAAGSLFQKGTRIQLAPAAVIVANSVFARFL
jgi:oxygen-independent coproporphyrinogen-3 oxidase